MESNGGGFDIADVGNTFTINQALSGTSSFTKNGPGRLVFSGAKTYTGQTVVDNGTLALSAAGSIAESSVVQLATGSMFEISASRIN